MLVWFVPLVMFAAGLYWVYSQRDLFRNGVRTYFWRETTGRVIDEEDRSFFVPGIVGTAGTGVGLVQYRETGYFYEYQVGLNRYVGDLFCFGVHLDKSLARHVVGDRVKVYYNPDNPHEAVLRRGVRSGALISFIPVAIGAIFLSRAFASRALG
jgi:hypothetical protein